MAIDARKLTLEVVLDGDKLVVKQLQNVEQAGDKAAAAQQLHGIKLATTYTAASQFVRDFIGVVKTAGAEVMQLAKEHADASTNVDKLAIALRSAGNYTAAGAAGLRDFADSMQIMVGQDGYQMLGFMAEAEDKTRVGTDTLKQMGVAAIGLAEINGTELGPAFDKVQRAANGQVKALTEMGIVLPKTATQQERINALLKATAGGFDEAIARVDNVTGKTAILGLVWGDLRVELGGFIDDNPYVMEAFDGIIGAVKDVTDGIHDWIDANPELANSLKQELGVALIEIAQLVENVTYGIGKALLYAKGVMDNVPSNPGSKYGGMFGGPVGYVYGGYGYDYFATDNTYQPRDGATNQAAMDLLDQAHQTISGDLNAALQNILSGNVSGGSHHGGGDHKRVPGWKPPGDKGKTAKPGDWMGILPPMLGLGDRAYNENFQYTELVDLLTDLSGGGIASRQLYRGHGGAGSNRPSDWASLALGAVGRNQGAGGWARYANQGGGGGAFFSQQDILSLIGAFAGGGGGAALGSMAGSRIGGKIGNLLGDFAGPLGGFIGGGIERTVRGWFKHGGNDRGDIPSKPYYVLDTANQELLSRLVNLTQSMRLAQSGGGLAELARSTRMQSIRPEAA